MNINQVVLFNSRFYIYLGTHETTEGLGKVNLYFDITKPDEPRIFVEYDVCDCFYRMKASFIRVYDQDTVQREALNRYQSYLADLETATSWEAHSKQFIQHLIAA
jgi:hypothetical protein